MSELDRMRRLAKSFARLEGETVALYRNIDGTYGFTLLRDVADKNIVEYISHL